MILAEDTFRSGSWRFCVQRLKTPDEFPFSTDGSTECCVSRKAQKIRGACIELELRLRERAALVLFCMISVIILHAYWSPQHCSTQWQLLFAMHSRGHLWRTKVFRLLFSTVSANCGSVFGDHGWIVCSILFLLAILWTWWL